jgi:hypothetical protein
MLIFVYSRFSSLYLGGVRDIVLVMGELVWMGETLAG